ncbi:MAG: DNA adenine methylase [bacterium]
MKVKSMSPLSYPGGKMKVVKRLLSPLFPNDFENYYEPFIGGGSVALYVAQLFPNKKIFINDIAENLIHLWKQIKDNTSILIKDLHEIRDLFPQDDLKMGEVLLEEMMEKLDDNISSSLEKAIAFYVVNKISFSGLSENTHKISKHNYKNKFNHVNIDKLKEVSQQTKNFEIYNEDFIKFLEKPRPNDFVFLDPPYKINQTLYGKNGKYHSNFDHYKLKEMLLDADYKWLMTYNDSDEIREMYENFIIENAEYRYCMSFNTDDNGNKVTRFKNELIIRNYNYESSI